MYHVVDIIHTDDLAFKVNSGNNEIAIDAKSKNGIAPPDALLASLGSCIGVYIRKYAEGAKLSLDNFKITVEAEFGPKPPFSFKIINVSIDLKGAKLDERRTRALLEFIKNCPVHNTLKGSPLIETKLMDGSKLVRRLSP
jgi:putative redox protein